MANEVETIGILYRGYEGKLKEYTAREFLEDSNKLFEFLLEVN